ncbi:GPW/gp25 family protein [Streptosporangium sp. NBC_01755]|uniref:GPW/gp25 family protein n=1 Tax=Streptosporangium sp. NBC_01755 TaxID=2975949 RepID=UPI002DD95301|nr:GPW/gp25 family protein [Streptosporangium sp. NBC_01755]WSD01106.1 GPW/gp25 family protein [Streptosporangium sp. NBC_01755]
MNSDYPHLGAGWRFPVTWTGGRAALTTSGEQTVAQSIGLIVRTALGERVMRPDFGADAGRHVFEPRTQQTCYRLGFEVRQALLRFEPRIIVDRVEAIPAGTDENRIDVTVEFRIDSHRRPVNLVLPFYREER